jgi:DNA relaxase NicK
MREHDLEYARLQVNQKKNRYGNILPCKLKDFIHSLAAMFSSVQDIL